MTQAVRTNESSRTERALTGLVVAGAGALMLVTMGRAVVFLVIALGISYAIWLTHGDWRLSRRFVPVLLLAVFVQGAHLAEEMWSGFYRAFPPVVGDGPWSARQFMIFNVIWLAIFLAAILGVLRQWRPAYVATLFLAIGGGIGNGLGHFALAIQAHGYFAGLYTAPFALLVGITLLFRHRSDAKPVVAGI